MNYLSELEKAQAEVLTLKQQIAQAKELIDHFGDIIKDYQQLLDAK